RLRRLRQRRPEDHAQHHGRGRLPRPGGRDREERDHDDHEAPVDLELAGPSPARPPGPAGERAGERGEQGGFTLIEILIALLILLIGMAGILSLQLTAMKATGFSRHATEATMLGDDKMEALRTVAFASLAGGSQTVDSQGKVVAGGYFTRA